MANNKMLIDAAHPEETRVAMVRGNRVDEFDFESEHKTQLRGNIYLAKVTRVEPSLQAAFVDYGGNRHGFLAFSEIHPDYYQIPMADRQALIDAEAEDARLDAQAEEEETEDTEEKPTRKRRSRRRKKSETVEADADDGAEEAPEAEETAEESDDTEDEIGAENDGDDVVSESAEEQKPKRRTSRPRKKKAEEPAATDEETEPPKKRTRRTKKSDAEDADTSVSEQSVSEEEKPKKRRTSRKKSEEPEAAVEETSEEEAPKKRRTSRKKVADAEAPAETAESSEEEKPKKRRTSRKKAEEPVEEATSETIEERTEENDEKPKRRRSRRSKKATEETPNDETQSEEKSDTVSDADTEADSDEASSDDDSNNSRRRSRRGRGRGRGRSKARNDNNDEDNGDSSNDDVDSIGAQDAMEEVPQRRTSRRHYKIQEVIKRRQILLVQVVKEERGNKGAALTTYLSLAGRYSVLMPNTARGGGISRKITNTSDRKRLKAIASDLEVPQGMGVILRTAGASQDSSEVQRDFEYLMRLWENVRTLTLQSTAPCLVYEEGSLIKRSIRDLYDRDTSEIIVAGEEGYREAKDFMSMLMPDQAKNVKLYKDRVPMFAKLGVEAQLDAMLQPQVTLKSGGYLIINQTEALVAIDVNSGRSTRQHSIEDTATQTNLEAADEVARQLRLRDLAGLIVIDFIDMEDRRNNRAVEKRLKDALKNDRARIQVGRISHFGLMEMSRQRMRASVLESTTQVCPTCEGVGHVRSSSSVSLNVLRQIEEQLNKNSRNNLVVKVNAESALYLLNHKREHVSDLENRFGVRIEIEMDASLGLDACTIERGEQASRRTPVEAAVQPDTIAPDAASTSTSEEEAQAPKQEKATASQSDDGEDGDDNNGRKRRRRRRRKRADNEEEANKSESNAAETASSSPEASSEETATEASKDTDEEQPVKPRRRTSRKAKDDVQEETEASKASSVEAEAEPKKARRTKKKTEKPVEENEAETSQEESAPRRRTTRRKKAGDESGDASKTEDVAATESSEAQNSEQDDSKPKKEGWWKRNFF